MRREPYPAHRLTGGLDLSVDPLFLTDQASPNLKLIRFNKGLLKKDLGFQDFSDTVSEVPMLMDAFYEVDGTEHFLLFTVDSTYEYNSTTDTWDIISGVDDWTGDEDNGFWYVSMPDSAGTLIGIFGNGKDAPRKWDGTTYDVLLGVGNLIPWQCVVFHNYLIMGGVTDTGVQCPFRIQWSDTADPETWAAGNTGFFDLIDTVDWITGFCLMGDRCFVFKERSIWELLYVGGTDIFEARIVVDGVGTYAPQSITSLGDEILFFGSDDIYLFDGVQLNSIGEQLFPLIYDTESKIVNHTKVNRAVGAYIEELAEYWLCLPTSGESPDWLVKYNFLTKSWTQRDLQVQCFGFYSALAAQSTWAEATTAWDSGDWEDPWKRKALPGSAPITIYCDATGECYQDDRLEPTTDEMVWESKDFLFAHGERVFEIRYLVRGNAFDVCYSLDGGVSYSTWETLTPSSVYFQECVQYVNLTTQTLRVKIRTVNEEFMLKWIEPWFVKRARSKELF